MGEKELMPETLQDVEQKLFNRISKDFSDTLIAQNKKIFDQLQHQTDYMRETRQENRKDMLDLSCKIEDLSKKLESNEIEIAILKHKSSLIHRIGWLFFSVILSILSFLWLHFKYLK